MLPIFRALGFLSLLPLGSLAHFETRHLPALLAAFPMAGALLGALLGACWHFFLTHLPPHLAAALAVCLWVVITRAFHLDGLADCADGIGGSYSRADRLRIMKDPHTGAFGVAAVVCALLLKYAALLALASPREIHSALGLWGRDPSPLLERVLVMALLLSSARFGVLIGACGAKYARDPEEGLGKDFIAATTLWVLLSGVIVPLSVSGLWGMAQGWPVVAAAAAAALVLRMLFRRALGGQTGDTLGATVEIAEIAGLIVLCSRA